MARKSRKVDYVNVGNKENLVTEAENQCEKVSHAALYARLSYESEKNRETLTKEMVNAFVEKIEIHESGSITVRLVYDDMLEELRKYAKEREAELCQ